MLSFIEASRLYRGDADWAGPSVWHLHQVGLRVCGCRADADVDVDGVGVI